MSAACRPALTSCLCVTYGRTAWLEHAIWAYLQQDIGTGVELVILNTCPEQTLSLHADVSDVRIVNLKERPKSLGEARNLAVKSAAGSHFITWDDDDFPLSDHVRTVVEAFGENDWIWLDRMMYSEGDDIKAITGGGMPVFAFSRKAWESVGGYAAMGAGEDRHFFGRVTSQFQGEKIAIVGRPTFIYGWAQGIYHASGLGEDGPGKLPVHDRVEADFRQRVKRGLEPVGDIVLTPQCRLDWERKANEFMRQEVVTAQKKRNLKAPVGIVELGRYGDICNVLPIAQHIAREYDTPRFYVSREFADLLAGVSYVDVRPLDIRNDQINKALELAGRECRFVVNSQIWGQNYEIVKVCRSYNRESWRLAGFGHKFDDPTWVPTFDRRDREREMALWRKIDDGRPAILVNVTKAFSSPYPQGRELLVEIGKWFPTHNVVDVAALTLPRIYDLVGLLDGAAAVVSIDSFLLHAAAATNTPMVALTNPNGWLGSEPRRPQGRVLSLDYNSSFDDIRNALHDALFLRGLGALAPPPMTPPPARTLWHCVERHDEHNPKEAVRKRVAQASWDVLYCESGVIPCHLWKYPRDGRDIGDRRALPYLRDVLAPAMAMAADDDIIFWTNDDNYLHPGLPELLAYHCAVYDVCTGQRCEFKSPLPRPGSHAEVYRAGDVGHMGRDLFAATRKWLSAHWDELPDFLLGASDFDLCLAAMVRNHFQIRSTSQNLESALWPAEIERGYVAHEFHAARWMQADNRDTAPSQVHNRRLFFQWGREHGKTLTFNPDQTITTAENKGTR